MTTNTGFVPLDAIVLAITKHEENYGYKITQQVRSVLDISESTLYPVLRRLERSECLDVYDREYAGRNRRYYRITRKGESQLSLYIEEWKLYKDKMDHVLLGGEADD